MKRFPKALGLALILSLNSAPSFAGAVSDFCIGVNIQDAVTGKTCKLFAKTGGTYDNRAVKMCEVLIGEHADWALQCLMGIRNLTFGDYVFTNGSTASNSGCSGTSHNLIGDCLARHGEAVSTGKIVGNSCDKKLSVAEQELTALYLQLPLVSSQNLHKQILPVLDSLGITLSSAPDGE